LISVLRALVMAVAAVAVTAPPSVMRLALIASVPPVAVSVSPPPAVSIASETVRSVAATMVTSWPAPFTEMPVCALRLASPVPASPTRPMITLFTSV
jgi:hypothetical protein